MTVPRAACYVADAIVLILEVLFDLWLLFTPTGQALAVGVAGTIGVPVLFVDWGILIPEGLFAWAVNKSCEQSRQHRSGLVS
jgi:hypothetical protein